MTILSHPNVISVHVISVHVISVHDIETFRGDVFIALDRVEGHPLRDWLSQERRSVSEILDVCFTTGRGLVAAHAAGLVHRDFKSSNIMGEGDSRVRVVLDQHRGQCYVPW
ncbi:MAG: hypothetical protein AAGC55_22450 [Myxococcota bacterium]